MPLAFVALASSAVKIIKESCELYKEGRQIVTDIAHEVDGVVKDVKAVQKKTKGLLGFLDSLFGVKEKPKQEVKEPVKKKKKQPPPEFDENLIYTQVADSLTKFFQAYNGLKNFVKEKQMLSLHVDDEEGQALAIQITIAELQMEKISSDLSNFMIYSVPNELKDLYTRINATIGDIALKQALARREELLKERQAQWQRQQKASLIQNRVVATVTTVLILLYAWILIISLTHSPSF
jgi:hypothetical protein